MLKKVLLFFFLLAGIYCNAQRKYQQDTEAPRNSTEEVQDESVVETVRPVEENTYRLQLDTSLDYLELKIARDSIDLLRSEKNYAYANYLDSLLRQRERQRDEAMKKEKDKQEKETSNNSKRRRVTYREESSESSDSFLDTILTSGPGSVIMIVLAVGFIAFVVSRLFLSDGVFKKNTKSTEAIKPVEEEEITPDSDVDKLIAEAVMKGNYRLAVRYWFLKSLHLLHEKNLLQMAQDKTNFQYVNELKDADLRNRFAGITLNYEYVWYGEFEVDKLLYTKLESAFTAFVNKL